MSDFNFFSPAKDSNTPQKREPEFNGSRLGDDSVKGIIPNFTGNVDVFNPKKNLAHFQEVATQLGLNTLKGIIAKNTLKFFQKPLPPGISGNRVLGHSVFGFPVFSNLLISGDSYQDNNRNTIGSFSDIRLDVVIMEMERENNLVTTDVQGRNGTIIEFIGSKSVNIHVTGRILAEQPGIYPDAEVRKLATALYSNKALRVDSWFLAMRGIYHIVIKKDSIKQEEGSQEYQKFEFDALADQPLILKIKK